MPSRDWRHTLSSQAQSPEARGVGAPLKVVVFFCFCGEGVGGVEALGFNA